MTFFLKIDYNRALKTSKFLVGSLKQGNIMERIRLRLKAYDHRVLDRSVASIVEAVKRTGS